jgi:hypothetical protein
VDNTETTQAQLLTAMQAVQDALDVRPHATPPPEPTQLPTLLDLFAASYVLEQIVAIPRTYVVLWTGTMHVTRRAYFVGLANNSTTNDPPRLITLLYTPGLGWTWPDDDPAYCGLIPPDWDLTSFEAVNPCGHTPPQVGP